MLRLRLSLALRRARSAHGPAVWRPLSTTSPTSSVVEELFLPNAGGPSAPGAAPPVPLARGEVLLYSSGPSTQRTVFLAWVGAATCTLYLGAVKAAELASPGVGALLSPAWTAVFGLVSVVTVQLARATGSCCVRHAVLERDGAHLRVYPYGALGLGAGAPVVLPIALLSLNEGFAERRKDAEALHVKVKESAAHLIFDKPAALYGIAALPGSGLAFDAKSGAAALLPSHATAAAADDAAAPASDAAAAARKEALRRYAVLVNVLGGHTVDAARVADGAFELARLRADLRPTGAAAAAAARSLWKTAVDPATQAAYYYHEATWQTQWTRPNT
jgi:hypothetical protein